jgi:hypothetical protein
VSEYREAIVVSIKGTNESVVVNLKSNFIPDITKALREASVIVLNNYLNGFFDTSTALTGVMIEPKELKAFIDANQGVFNDYCVNDGRFCAVASHKVVDAKERTHNISLSLSTCYMLDAVETTTATP